MGAPKYITPDIANLGRILDEITETGIAFDNDEHTDGICAAGFAFEDWAGNIHAISVPVPTSLFFASEGTY